ncbi:pyridoxamine 5'-phosphate oxidase family protein [Parahaliea mediterranea]|uniref:pyridoxamine 5'-phosphate oxidase family protein n=1 Tax=Parahaliea mediterranea TaxID=651086 RepID=UPI000E2E8E09|nr:pyridoxamine 5'-phosphate oxidase family protein [Parahaliea mediterranea]
MNRIETLDALEQIYDAAVPIALDKVQTRLTPRYRQWIASSRFLILATVGKAGTDASPRGDAGPVVQVRDDTTLLLPDWRGNNRLDSLRNIVEDGRVSLLFMVPGCNNVVRVNGSAIVTADDDITSQFNQQGKTPRTVIVVTIAEVYYQCAKALMRSCLWQAGDESESVPTAGQFVQEIDADFDAASYDTGYADYAKGRLW